MSAFVVSFTALAFSWFGQLPPHGEVERDLLTFLLFSLLVAGAGWRWQASTAAENAGDAHFVKGATLRAFLALWLGLLLLVLLQWQGLPAEVWSGRQWMALGWLLAAGLSAGLGAVAAPAAAAPERAGSAWRAVATGVVIAAVFNALVAGLQVALADALPSWLPAAPLAGRGYGALLQPNLTATLLVLGLVSLSSSMVVSDGVSRKAGGLAVVVAVVLGAGVALTGSRTGFVLLLLWALVQAWRNRGALRRGLAPGWPLLGLVLVLLAALSRDSVADLTTAVDRGATLSNGRALIYANALRIGEAFPWFGAGFNQLSFWHADLPYQPKMPGYLTHAHNLLLQFWAEMGVVGVVWVVGALGCLAWPLRQWREAAAWPESRRWALSVLAVLLLHSMTELPLWSAPFLLLFGFTAGIWLAVDGTAATARRMPMARLGQVFAIMGLLGVLATVWVYRDYLKISALYDGARWPVNRSGDVAGRANSSLFFHPAAEFAAANSTPVTEQNAAAFARTLPGLWRYVTDARMYEWQLRTDAWQGDGDAFAYHAQRFAWLYPDEFAAFKAQVQTEQATRPWTGFSPVWP
jgi:O-antigen ligase